MSNINIRLCMMRKYLKLTQAEFGATGGVSQSTQNRYEQNASIPISYLNKIYREYGADINENWFYFGKGQMLTPSDTSFPLSTLSELSAEEIQIIDKATQFSTFLRSRPLRPEMKRHLVELLIESINQALTALPDNDPVLEKVE